MATAELRAFLFLTLRRPPRLAGDQQCERAGAGAGGAGAEKAGKIKGAGWGSGKLTQKTGGSKGPKVQGGGPNTPGPAASADFLICILFDWLKKFVEGFLMPPAKAIVEERLGKQLGRGTGDAEKARGSCSKVLCGSSVLVQGLYFARYPTRPRYSPD